MQNLSENEMDCERGTQELEKGMQPSSILAVVVVICNVVLVLSLLNSAALVKWTQQLPSSPASIWIAERAADWEALSHTSPSDVAARLRNLVKIDEGS